MASFLSAVIKALNSLCQTIDTSLKPLVFGSACLASAFISAGLAQAKSIGTMNARDVNPLDTLTAFQNYAEACASDHATQTVFKAEMHAVLLQAPIDLTERAPKKASIFSMQEPSKLSVSYGASPKSAADVAVKREFIIRFKDTLLRVVYDASSGTGPQMFTASCARGAKL